ncbi:hypothetical protein J2Z37_000431 [Ammoniphilus resinae]|uniref:Post-transcriptional regulator n=2 Tax=Ammoniphilus resinae TaxID=861532 RepID=A0ABS4GJM0_9BACL|nr:post-transcriptional regulator [Ammoniphilus resinae]MBP1930444.1 hypothetical protein [Ammoniphilus resinae]
MEANEAITLEELRTEMRSVCQSKAEEFHLLGYEHVTADEIWDCVASRYKNAVPALHQLVNDILSLKATVFMNWMTMRIYRGEFE